MAHCKDQRGITANEGNITTVIQSLSSLYDDFEKDFSTMTFDFNGLLGQGYDDAANMSGKLNGVQAVVLQEYPKACYTHCCTHCSHPVISTACANNATNNNAKKLYKIFTSSTFSPAARSEVAC